MSSLRNNNNVEFLKVKQYHTCIEDTYKCLIIILNNVTNFIKYTNTIFILKTK